MKLQAQDLSLLAQWLAAADIDYLELRSPDLHVRIHQDGKTELAPEPPAPQADFGAAQAKPLSVCAASVGVLLDRIPGRAEPLVALGQAVQSGSLLALLQVGPLLLPVRAPCNGLAGPWLAAPGSVVGYGTPLLELHREEHEN